MASLSDVVNTLAKTQVKREFLLGDTPRRTKPTPQQRPEAFHRIDLHFTKAVAIFIAGVLAPPMVDALMAVSPSTQARINAVFIRVNHCPWITGVFDERLERLLLHLGPKTEHHLTTTLNHPKDGWSFLRSRTTATLTFASASTSFPALFLHHLRLACRAGNPIGVVQFHDSGIQ